MKMPDIFHRLCVHMILFSYGIKMEWIKKNPFFCKIDETVFDTYKNCSKIALVSDKYYNWIGKVQTFDA